MDFTEEFLEVCRRRKIDPENLPPRAVVEIVHGTNVYAHLPVSGMIEGEIRTHVRWYEDKLGLPADSGKIHVNIISP